MSDEQPETNKCPGGGMADAEDSKSFVGNNVGVQVPSRAPIELKTILTLIVTSFEVIMMRSTNVVSEARSDSGSFCFIPF
ncbi:MAG: hypothetical protein K0R55_4394 [Sporomusa sp.]|nr:hypothetical protein [Sporomusa sp.]